MDPIALASLGSWSIDPLLGGLLLALALCYARGWSKLAREHPARFGARQLCAFLAGFAALFLAIASPLDAFSGFLLSAHMLQHLLLTMVAPPLLWLGAPFVPLLRGLPVKVLVEGLGPFLAWPVARRASRFLVHPVAAWLAFVAAMIAGHLPGVYELALRSRAWHDAQHAVFLGAALLFWWPVVQPYPSRAAWTRWALIPYLVLADLANTALAAFLIFCDRVLYPHYASAPRLFGLDALEDQAAAGVLMWVLGSLAFLVPAALITLQLLGARGPAPRRARSPGRAAHAPVRKPFDLLALRGIGPFVASRGFRRALQLVLFALAAAVVVDGWLGPEQSPLNLAGVLPWTLGRGLAVIALLAAGNLVCMGCPLMLARDASRRLLAATRYARPRFAWPRALRSKWLAVAVVALFLWSYETFALWDDPRATAALVVGAFGSAIAVDALFRGASFCKYICPLGQFQFVASQVSPLEVGVRDPAACTTCTTHDCIRGNERARGCELELFLPRKSGNLDCTFCLDCARACPHDNVGLTAGAPGRDLARDERRSALGRFAERPDLAALMLLLSFGAFANAAAMVAPVLAWRADAGGFAFTLAFAACALALPALALLGCAAIARACGSLRKPVELAASLAPALVPLGAAMWAAHFLFHFFSGFATASGAVERAFGDAGLASAGWTLALPAFTRAGLQGLELWILDLGLLLALLVAWRIARRLDPLRAWSHFLPVAALAIALFAAGAWIVLQPMQMRGT